MINTVTQKSIAKEARWYVQKAKLPIIPVCSAQHEGMSDAHKMKCRSPGKMPLLQGWSTIGNTTMEQINTWFTGSSTANIGLKLGQSDYYNLVGIDIDGEAGEQLLLDWSGGYIPTTWEFKTSGGRRLLYKLPMGAVTRKFKQTEKGEHQELALLAQGQQTVMPPSKHNSGFVYEWVHSPQEVPLFDAPMWLYNRVVLTQNEGVEEMVHGAIPISDPTLPTEWTENIGEGGRNNHLARLAGTLIAKKNIPKPQVLLFLKSWNTEHCKPPLPDREIEQMVENIYLSEQTKGAKQLNKIAFSPQNCAHMFLNLQKEQGFVYRYSETRGHVYRASIVQGPWLIVSEEWLSVLILEVLFPYFPDIDSTRKLKEVADGLKRALHIAPLADQVDDPDPEIIDDIFNLGKYGRRNLIFFENGMLDVDTQRLLPWRTDTYSTIQIRTSWDAGARTSPLYQEWEELLENWIPEQGAREVLQEFIGYTLVPDCKFRQALFLVGGGKNGKSLFLDCVSKLYGPHMSTITLHRLGERFERVGLVDSLVNICADIDNNYVNNTGIIKALIAGDEVSAEFKFGKTFTFQPITRYIFSANDVPRTNDKSEGWASRWKYINFPKQFAVDPMFAKSTIDKFTSEQGRKVLVSWAVEGLTRLRSRNAFSTSQELEQVHAEYKAESDPTGYFIEHALIPCESTATADCLLPIALYEAYKNWCENVGCRTISKIMFDKRLKQVGYKKVSRKLKTGRSASMLAGAALNMKFEDIELVKQDYNFNMSMAINK